VTADDHKSDADYIRFRAGGASLDKTQIFQWGFNQRAARVTRLPPTLTTVAAFAVKRKRRNDYKSPLVNAEVDAPVDVRRDGSTAGATTQTK